MPERYLYEYAVIRVVPRVEREEFINVGIILFSKRKKFLRAKYVLHEEKLKDAISGNRYRRRFG